MNILEKILLICAIYIYILIFLEIRNIKKVILKNSIYQGWF